MGVPFQNTLRRISSQNVDEKMLAQGFKFIRYADDYVVLCRTRQEAGEALELSEQVLEKLLLALDEKDIVSFEQGFTYLGVTFAGGLIMTPFDRPKKNHGVLFYPAPFDLETYLRDRRSDAAGPREADGRNG